MAKKALTSKFVKIAQSGRCVDGREIQPQWLLDMAETYDPAVYTALIWPDHMRWAGNYGSVTALKAEADGPNGPVSLFAQLAPNGQYLWENAQGQRLFFSVEVEPNFAGSGKAYLGGLGITDSPASLGTEETRFASRKHNPGNIFVGNTPVDLPEADEADGSGKEEAPGWFQWFIKTFLNPEKAGKEEFMAENETTPAEEAKAPDLAAKIDALEAQLKDIMAKLDKLAGEDKEKEPEKEPESKAEGNFTSLAAQLDGLKATLEAMDKKFSAPRPGTATVPNTGAAADKVLL